MKLELVLKAVKLKCREVWREISNYVEGTLDRGLRTRMDAHFRGCRRCSAVRDGAHNVSRLAGNSRAFELPAGFEQRLRHRLSEHLAPSPEPAPGPGIPLGITAERVPLGSHLVYFWERDEEFARAVRFLEVGLRAGDGCFVHGHAEANLRVLEILRERGFDTDRLIAEGRVSVFPRDTDAKTTLENMGAAMNAAQRHGAKAIRVLGNLGVGRDPLPAGEGDVLELEARGTGVIAHLPVVLICMYDVRALPGRLLLKGGIQSHPYTCSSKGIRENPHCLPEETLFRHLRLIQ
ncbi:MAG: MEDS domain-containing protein [Acidobacteria bacterium]|nr:MEDS domain-containing protein [Acidobacteriota bacterium]